MLSQTSKSFRTTYLVNIVVMLLLLLAGGMAGTQSGSFLFGLYLHATLLVTPFMFVFLILNIWGATKYTNYRSGFLILASFSVVWIVFGVYEALNMTPP